MTKDQDLLTSFGFTTRAACQIIVAAYHKGLTYSDIKAWITEAESSTSIINPLGFVRSRLQNGDKPPPVTTTASPHLATQICTCGRLVPATHICPDCHLCPTCCTCDLPNSHKETTMNSNATATTAPLAYALTLLSGLPQALRHRTTGLIQLTNQRNHLAQQVCTGRPHWRDRNAEGKTAKLYVLHSTDQSCPIHGTPDPGARLRVYVGNKPTLVADALAAIERTTEHDNLQRRLRALLRSIDSVTYWAKACYRELDYHVPGPHEHEPPRPRPHPIDLTRKEP